MSLSPVLASLNAPDVETMTLAPLVLSWVGVTLLTTGASLVDVRSNVWLTLPPCPSSAVTVT